MITRWSWICVVVAVLAAMVWGGTDSKLVQKVAVGVCIADAVMVLGLVVVYEATVRMLRRHKWDEFIREWYLMSHNHQ